MTARAVIVSLQILFAAAWPGSGALADTGLSISNPWIREAPPASQVHAGYMSLANRTQLPVTITAISSKDYSAAEIHRSWIEDGVARMEALQQLVVQPGDSLELAPGGYHLMLFNPVRSLQAGDSVTIRLETADGNCHTIEAPVRRATPETEH